MEIRGEIKGFLLIKFKSRKIINSVQSGKIYFNSLKWFRDYENESGDMVVGDSFEGMLHINDGEFIIKDTGEYKKLEKALIPTVASNSYVFCMSYINPTNDEFAFDDIQKEEFRKFGDTALVILDSNEFINRVRNAAAEKGYQIYFNNVHYYDENIDLANIWISLFQGAHNIVFWKRKSYIQQQEFRIVIPHENCTEDHIELEIGDIGDISMICSTEQILSAKIIKRQ